MHDLGVAVDLVDSQGFPLYDLQYHVVKFKIIHNEVIIFFYMEHPVMLLYCLCKVPLLYLPLFIICRKCKTEKLTF